MNTNIHTAYTLTLTHLQHPAVRVLSFSHMALFHPGQTWRQPHPLSNASAHLYALSPPRASSERNAYANSRTWHSGDASTMQARNGAASDSSAAHTRERAERSGKLAARADEARRGVRHAAEFDRHVADQVVAASGEYSGLGGTGSRRLDSVDGGVAASSRDATQVAEHACAGGRANNNAAADKDRHRTPREEDRAAGNQHDAAASSMRADSAKANRNSGATCRSLDHSHRGFTEAQPRAEYEDAIGRGGPNGDRDDSKHARAEASGDVRFADSASRPVRRNARDNGAWPGDDCLQIANAWRDLQN